MAGQPGRHGALARASCTGWTRWTPTSCCSQISAGAARQRRRRQLQRGRQGGQGAASRRRTPTAACTRTCAQAAALEPAESSHSSEEATSMDLQLQGRRALVTGGTRGHRPRHRRGASAEGAAVGFCARTAARGDRHRRGVRRAAAATSPAHASTSPTGGTGRVGRGRRPTRSAASTSWSPTSARWRSRTTEENWQASFEVDLMHTVRPGQARRCRTWSAATPRRSSRSPACPAARSTSRPARTAPSKAAIIHYIQGLALPAGRQGHPGQHASRPATPTSRAASGRASSRRTRTCSRRPWRSTRPAGWRTPEEIARAGGVPGQPRGQPHQRHQPRRRRRPDPRRPVLRPADWVRGIQDRRSQEAEHPRYSGAAAEMRACTAASRE